MYFFTQFLFCAIFVVFVVSSLSLNSILSYYETTEDNTGKGGKDRSCIKCNYTLVSPKKVINPYREEMKNVVIKNPFSSFCIKCAACLAVAEEIEKVMRNTIDECQSNLQAQNVMNEELSGKITELCSNGFKNFNLRKFEEHKIITDVLKCSSHVPTNYDVSWTRKLREICSTYMSHMDVTHLSNDYVDGSKDIILDLCRGSGIFRDCLNLGIDSAPLQKCEQPTCECDFQ